MTTPRVTGIGGVFFKARDGATVWSIFPDDAEYFGAAGQRAMLDYRVGDLDRALGALPGEGNRIELWQPPPGR